MERLYELLSLEELSKLSGSEYINIIFNDRVNEILDHYHRETHDLCFWYSGKLDFANKKIYIYFTPDGNYLKSPNGKLLKGHHRLMTSQEIDNFVDFINKINGTSSRWGDKCKEITRLKYWILSLSF